MTKLVVENCEQSNLPPQAKIACKFYDHVRKFTGNFSLRELFGVEAVQKYELDA